MFRKFFYITILWLLFFIFTSDITQANTTDYHSASTVTTAGSPSYTDLANCSKTDGLTCNRTSNSSFSNIYFRDFGDFGIPEGSTVNTVRIRVTGKASVPVLGLYAGVSSGGGYTLNCQDPSDHWTMNTLNSSTIRVYNSTTSLTNGNLSECLKFPNITTNNFTFRINYSFNLPWSANIDNFEIAFDYTPPPTLTPTPTPTGPAPFLDLPWDYEQSGQSFSDAVLSINSYFDHSYPLLGFGITEPQASLNQVTTYTGESSTSKSYSTHNGYDYGRSAQVQLGDFVLAAAEGEAEFINSCAACGNMIKIDHGNHFQTVYMHLLDTGLITSIPGTSIHVNDHQKIGEVGFTGRVLPNNENGAHIHFGLIYDKDNDGNFNNNALNGLTDPFGWQGNIPDPWENYSFSYGDSLETGTKSYYLWEKPLGESSGNISSTGGSLSSNRFSFLFPQNAVSGNTTISLTPRPAYFSATFSSIGPTLLAIAKDSLGNEFNNFLKPFTLTIDFSSIDLSLYNLSTLSIYSSPDGQTWSIEPTTIDLDNYRASTQLSHFTHFALMADLADIVSPTTYANLSGSEGEENWFRSNVSLTFSSEDNEGGLGVQYSAYKTNDEGWQKYTGPISLSEEGHHKVEYYSEDNAGNIEDVKSLEFDIDKAPPSISLWGLSPAILWPPNGKDTTVKISGSFFDDNLNSAVLKIQDEYNKTIPSIGNLSSPFEEEFNLPTQRYEYDLSGRVYAIMLEAIDKAGNKSTTHLEAVVPHDQGN